MALNGAYAASKFSTALTLTNGASVLSCTVVRLVPGTFQPSAFVIQSTTDGAVRIRQIASSGFVNLEAELTANNTAAWWAGSTMPTGSGTSRRIDVDIESEMYLAVYMDDTSTVRIACASRTGATAPTSVLERTLV